MKPFFNAEKNKHTFFALVLYICWVISFTVYSFIEQKQELYRIIDQKLVEAAKIPSLLLDDSLHHKGITKDSLTQSEDIENRNHLSAYTDSNTIVYIYTLILQGNKIFFTSSSATREERESKQGLTNFFDHYDDVDERVYDVFETKQRKFIEYSDQWGTFRSVFIPLQAKDGSYYVAAADISISHISKQLRQHLYRTLIVAMLFLAFVFPIYYTANRKIKTLAMVLAKKVQEQSTELESNAGRLQLAMKVSKQGWFDLNLLTGIVKVSDEYPEILGYDSSNFNSSLEEWKNNIHPDDQDFVLTVFQDRLVDKEPRDIEYRRRNKNGSWVWIHSIAQVVERDEHNNPCRIVGILTNISERKRSEHVLRVLAESGSVIDDNVFKRIVRELAIALNTRYAIIACLDPGNTEVVRTLVVWKDGEFSDNFSYALAGTPCQLVTDQDVVCYPDNIQQLFPDDLLLVEMEAVSYLGVSLKNSSNEVLGLLALIDDKPMAEDIYRLDLLGSLAVRIANELERRNTEKQLKLSTQVFKAAHEGIVITDVDGIIVDVNPAFCDITGYSRQEAVGENPSLLSSGRHRVEFFAEMWKTLVNQGFWRGELWNRKKTGEIFAELLTISAIQNDRGETQNYIGLFSDITKSKEQQKSLELMAHYDMLTGLPNRSLFMDRYKQAVARSKRTKTLLAVCFLDLDEFKPVNDSFGHSVGDKLLVKVAKKIQSELRSEDTVSRMGGDEFALLLGDISSVEQCEYLMQRLHKSLSEAFTVEGHVIHISASSGITFYPRDNADLDTLLRHADQAMYQAKLSGRNRYHIFDFEEDQQLVDKQQRLQQIQNALEQGEMQLYYQPKVNMRTGKVFGVEALIRWIHPEKGLIPPLDFLPVIDGTEIETQLGQWVIDKALKQLEYWRSIGLILEVSVNISSYHLQSPYFIRDFKTVLERYPKVNSNYLQLEILESSALGDISAIRNIITACRDELGLHIALDDFGTGYSSLTHLRNLPANTLKIDQSFVKNLLDDVNDCAIINGIIGLANAFNREVIAEGVETLEHGEMLLLLGCEQAQGYVIAKPMPENEIFDWVKNYAIDPEWVTLGSHKVTPAQNKIKLFQLCLQQWYQLFTQNITLPLKQDKNWPVWTQHKCHHAIRLKQLKQEKLLSDDGQKQIDHAYETFQWVANDLFTQYICGDTANAQDGLSELDRVYQIICSELESELEGNG